MTKKTRAQLLLDAASTLPDNQTHKIKPADVRGRITDLIDSAMILGETDSFATIGEVNTIAEGIADAAVAAEAQLRIEGDAASAEYTNTRFEEAVAAIPPIASIEDTIEGDKNDETTAPVGVKRAIWARKATISSTEFGISEAALDNKANLEAAYAQALADGKALKIKRGRYRYSTLDVPDELVIEGYGVTLAREGDVGTQPWFLRFGDNVKSDALNLEFDGTEVGNSPTASLVVAGDDFNAGKLSLIGATEIGNINGFTSEGRATRIETLAFENIAYGPVFRNLSLTELGEDNVIEYLRMRNYMRYFYGVYAAVKLGSVRCEGRSAFVPAAKGRYISGLWEGCRNSQTGDVYLQDCGHGARVGGSPHANARIENLTFGRFFLTNARGDAFKIAPSRLVSPGVTEKAYNITHAGVESIDGGDGVAEGNRDFIRLTHAVGVEIGPSYAPIRNQSFSHQTGVLLNDVQGVRLHGVGGDNFNSGMVVISGTSDILPGPDPAQTFPGPVTNVCIFELAGRCTGSNAIAVEAEALDFGDIFINVNGIAGQTRVFARYNAGVGNLIGKFRLTGTVGGVVLPVYLNAPDTDDFSADIEWNGLRGVGMAARLSHRAAFEIVGFPMDLGASPGSKEFGGLFISNYGATAGDMVPGGTILFGRPGTQYANVAAGALQDGATLANMGFGIWTSATASATHQKILSAFLRANGDFELMRTGKNFVARSPNGDRWGAKPVDAAGPAGTTQTAQWVKL